MWSKETKEEKERKKEQAFYEHYSAMGKSTDSIRKEWERRKRNEQRIRRLKRRRRIAIDSARCISSGSFNIYLF